MSVLEHVVPALTDLLGPTQVIADADKLAFYRLDGLRPSRGYRDLRRHDPFLLFLQQRKETIQREW